MAGKKFFLFRWFDSAVDFLGKIFGRDYSNENINLEKIGEQAVHAVEVVQVWLNDPTLNLAVELTNTNWDDEKLEEVKAILPTIILNLLKVKTLEDAAVAFEEIKVSDDDAENRFYHDLAVALARYFSDRKLSYGECVLLVEIIYKRIQAKKLEASESL